MSRRLRLQLCSFCRSVSTSSRAAVAATPPPVSVDAVPGPLDPAVLGKWAFELPPEISARPRARSFIFDEPINWHARAKDRKRIRRDAFIHSWKAGWTPEQVKQWERWWADPWFKMQQSPIRDCVVTKQKLPMALLVNFRKALVYPEDRRRGVRYKPVVYVLPDRVEHPRYSHRKKGFGFWVLCNRHVLDRLGDPVLRAGPHSRFVRDSKAEAPRDIPRLVYIQLVERIVQELRVLRDEMRAKRRKKSSKLKGDPRLAISESIVEGTSGPPKILSRCTASVAADLRAGNYPGREAVAFLNILGMGSGRTQRHKERQARLAERTNTVDPGENLSEGSQASASQSVPEHAEVETNTALAPLVDADTHVQIPEGFRTIMIKTPITEIPLYTLKDMLPHAKQVEVRKLIAEILAAESIQRAQHRRKTIEDQTTPKVQEKPSNVLVLSAYPRSDGGKTRRGDLGTNLAIALWRLRWFLGEGWEGFFVDIKGRRV